MCGAWALRWQLMGYSLFCRGRVTGLSSALHRASGGRFLTRVRDPCGRAVRGGLSERYATCLGSTCVSSVRSALSERMLVAAAEAHVQFQAQPGVAVELAGELVGGVLVAGPVHAE